jgi:hypothetical protein
MAEVTAEVTVKIGNARVLIEALFEVFPRWGYGGPVFETDPNPIPWRVAKGPGCGFSHATETGKETEVLNSTPGIELAR